jgi:gas vesicle protein
MESSGSSSKVFNALIIGAAVGAACGILFAPDKGSRTRRRLMRSAEDIKDNLKEKIKDEVGALKDKVEELEGLAENIIDDLKSGIRIKADAGVKNHEK